MYEYKCRVRYSESMNTGYTSPVSIASYFQDCAIEHSASLGKDINYYKQINRAWLLNSWQIDIKRYPACGETIFVRTWSYGFQGLYGYRNFVILDENRAMCVCANSVWFYADTANGRPVRVPKEEGESFGREEKLPMEYCPRKIAMPDGLLPLPPYTVCCHDIDTNGHVNNSRYIELTYHFLPDEIQRDNKIRRVRAEYKKAAIQGDCIMPSMATLNAEAGIQYALCLANGQDIYANIIFYE